jgi:tetratricopeptide (TPR) repeat protein
MLKTSYILNSAKPLQYLTEALSALEPIKRADEEFVVVYAGNKDCMQLQQKNPWVNLWIVEKDRGEAHGWNKGILRSSGLIIKLLTDDDYFDADAIHKDIDMLYESDCEVLFSNGETYDADGKLIGIHKIDKPGEKAPFKRPPGLAVMFKRTILPIVGLVDTTVTAVDVDFLHRIIFSGIKILYSDSWSFKRHLNEFSGACTRRREINSDIKFALMKYSGLLLKGKPILETVLETLSKETDYKEKLGLLIGSLLEPSKTNKHLVNRLSHLFAEESNQDVPNTENPSQEDANQDVHNIDVLAALGLICSKMGQYQQAKDYFKSVILKKPDDIVSYIGLGLTEKKLNEYDTINENTLPEMLQDNDYVEWLSSYINDGLLYFSDFKDKQRLLSKEILDVERYAAIADKAIHEQDLETAETALHFSLTNAPKLFDGFMSLVNELSATKCRLEQAKQKNGSTNGKEDFNGELIQDIQSPEELLALADIYLDAHKFEEATDYFKLVILKKPDDITGYMGLAIAAKNLKDEETLKIANEKIHELDPSKVLIT